MKRKNIIAAALLSLLAAVPATAQQKRIFLASKSTSNPNERPIWSDAQAQAWFDAHSPIIGVNHPERPCEAMSYDDAVAKAASIGFNSVRIWPFGGSDYISSVEYWAGMCDKNGMTLAPVFGFSHVPTSASDSTALRSKVKSIVTHFRGDKRILFWDIWNEPALNGDDCEPIMKWIRIIARWCREAGCTQPITSSILWDGAMAGENKYTTYRRAAEAEMDLHNFHDYAMQAAHEGETQNIIKRYAKINNKPIICTEALRRDDGSGVAVSLRQFAKYRMGFYTWGLYSCDANWDTQWGYSTWYAFEPMFHNLLFAGGDPVDERELSYIKNFRFASNDADQVVPGAEITERWTERRAWKWMNDSPYKGYTASSKTDALSFIAKHASDGIYNTIAVKFNISDFISSSSAFYTSLEAMAAAADKAGMRLVPILTESADLGRSVSVLEDYIYKVVLKYYMDRRIAAWCVFRQTTAEPTDYRNKFSTLFSYIRYAFPCQPMFAAPLVSSSVKADSTATDFANYLWQLSDITAFSTKGSEIGSAALKSAFASYKRPLLFLGAPKVEEAFAATHTNFFLSSDLSSGTKALTYTPLDLTDENDTIQMPSWKAWASLNCAPVKGLSYNSVSEALTGLAAQKGKGIYNSIQVRLTYTEYTSSKDKFKSAFSALLDSAGTQGMTVVPTLLYDRYARLNPTALCAYVADMIRTYNDDPRIAAWELYNRPSLSSSAPAARMLTLIPQIFTAARSAAPKRPVFVTPAVKTSDFDAGFDYIVSLQHFNEWAGWNKLQYYSGNISLTHLCWKLSDIVSYSSDQQEPQLGWLNSVAYRYGRPVVCSRWEASKSTTVDKILTVFNDCHTSWYSDTPLDESKAKTFDWRPVVTDH